MNTGFWLKCHIVFDEDCKTSELCLTRLAIHNLKLNLEFLINNCQVSEFPIYMTASSSGIENKIFSTVHKIVIQPVTPFPKVITTEQIDAAVQSHFNSFKFPLSLNHQVVILINCESNQFAAIFKITKIEPNFSEQFVFNDKTEVYLKLQVITDEKIPKGLQQSLPKSIYFPRIYLFSSFPKSKKIDKFLNSKGCGTYPLSTALIHGPFGSGKRTYVRKLADDAGVPFYSIDLYDEKEEVYSSSQNFLNFIQDKFNCSDQIVIDGIELIQSNLKLPSIWSQISQENRERNLKLVCIHSYLNSRSLSDYYIGSFDVVDSLIHPGTDAIMNLVREMFELIPEASEIVKDEDFIGYKIGDFIDLVEDFKKIDLPFKIIFEEFKTKMKFRKSLQLNTLEIPKVTWDQVAGLSEVKLILQDLIVNLQQKPRPTGILLYGPPGTGKTLIAKALATQSRFALLPIKGPELLSPYIGESESSLREVFMRARSMSPCIIFFDELDALVPNRGEFSDSVGVADRMVATFMTEMDKINDGTEDNCCVFVIGATNRPDLIDKSLMRKGRFDLSILLDAPKSIEERASILEASCKKLNCSNLIDFFAPFKCIRDDNLTPAQIASIATNASKMALERKLEEIRSNPNEENLLINPITTEDLMNSALQLFQ